MSASAVPIATKLKYLVKPFLRYSGGIFLYVDEDLSSSLIIKEKIFKFLEENQIIKDQEKQFSHYF